MVQGHLPEALIAYQANLAIRAQLANPHPGNTGWQSDLSTVVIHRSPTCKPAQGHLPEALNSYQVGLAIANAAGRSLIQSNASWQRGSVSVVRESRQMCRWPQDRQRGGARLLSGRHSHHCRDRLATPIPVIPIGSAIFRCQDDKVGHVQKSQGHLPEALMPFISVTSTIA